MESFFRENTVFFERNLERLYILQKLLVGWYVIFPLLYVPAAIRITNEAPHVFISYMFVCLGFTTVLTGWLVYHTNLRVLIRNSFKSLTKVETMSIIIAYSSGIFIESLTPIELQLPVLYTWLTSILASILLVNFYVVLPLLFILVRNILSSNAENLPTISEKNSFYHHY